MRILFHIERPKIVAAAFLFVTLSACGIAGKETADANKGSAPAAVVPEEVKPEEPADKTGDKVERDPAKILSESTAFFANSVLPGITANCTSCHAEPRFKPATPGPLTILGFENMRKLVRDGTDAINNKFMNKVRNIVAHGGGDRCGTDMALDPCKILIAWGEIEYGAPAALPADTASDRIAAKLEDISATGKVTGYAAWAGDPKSMLEVRFYVDGDEKTGTAVAPTTANKSGYSDGIVGGHLFQLDLAATYKNAQSHSLSAYVTVSGKSVELTGSPMNFKAWVAKGAADFWTASVSSTLNSCRAACHVGGRTYTDFNILIDPSPAKGATATTNTLYLRAHNQAGHSGANCDAACGTALSQWWTREFGP
jgi:hypothetical protein